MASAPSMLGAAVYNLLFGKMKRVPKLNLPNFRDALKKEHDAAEELGLPTLRRYIVGDFPKTILWLMKYPRVMRGLLKDAEHNVSAGALRAQETAADERSRKAIEARRRREGVTSE